MAEAQRKLIEEGLCILPASIGIGDEAYRTTLHVGYNLLDLHEVTSEQ